MHRNKIFLLGVLAMVATATTAWVRYNGSPRWPSNNGFNYVADLRPTSFPTGGTWDQPAQFAMADWRDVGATAFRAGITRTASDPNDHGDGRNAWFWTNRPSDTWLGITYVRWSGSTMNDCDIWYNSRPDYRWSSTIEDPCVYRNFWPVSFRNVARHEVGHAIGFRHEDDTLTNMNTNSTHGSGVQHLGGSGVLPHADDKAAVRALYPGTGTVRNVMATNWREPATMSARQESEETGTWAAGTNRTLEFWLSNQSNVSIPGLAGGIRTGVYLSTNDIISTFDTRIYEVTYSSEWGAGASGRFTPSVRVPDTMPSGSYYVGAFFDNAALVNETGTGATEGDNTCVLGQVNVTNTLRRLNLSSDNPTSTVAITVNRADSNGAQNGSTPFSRTYWGSSQSVQMTAPASSGNNPFRHWELNGVAQGASRTLTVTMNRTQNAQAVYWERVIGREVITGRAGCRGSNGVVPVHRITHSNGSSGNQQGTSTRWTLTGARSRASAVMLLGSAPRSLNLGTIGAPACWLNHIIDSTQSRTTSSAGAATVTLTLPAQTFALGRNLYSTFAVIDQGANGLNLAFSNSMRLTVGGLRP